MPLPKGFRPLTDEDAARLNDRPRSVFLFNTVDHTVTRWKVGDYHDMPILGGSGGWTVYRAASKTLRASGEDGLILRYPTFTTLGDKYIACEIEDVDDLTAALRQSLGYPLPELVK